MDRFDDIWKNRFNGSDKPVADWGVPDDSVWEGIAPHIEEKPDRMLLWWITFGIGTLILLFALFSNLVIFNNGQTVELTENVTNMEAIAVDSQLTINNTPENSISESTTYDEAIEEGGVVEQILIKKKNIPSYIIEAPQTFTQTTSNFSFQKNIENTISKNNFSNESVSEKLVEQIALDELPFLPFLKSNLETTETPSFTFFEIENKVEPMKRQKRFSVSVSSGAVLWKHRISDRYTSDLSRFDFNYTDEFGWQAAILGAAQLGNYFELKSGIRLEKVKVGSGHNSDIDYDPTNEVIPNSNNYPTILATPYGLTPAEFVLNRNSDIGSDKVALKVDFHSNHDITNINVPLDIGFYPFGKKKTLKPFVKAGVGYNYVSKISNKIRDIDTHHSAIVFDENSQTFADPDIQNSFFDLRFGAGINYQLTNRFQLNLLYDFSRGINPVFEYEIENYKTVIDRQYYSLELRSSF